MRSLINFKTDKSFSREVMGLLSKMFTKLVVCSLIPEAHVSKCHLEVVAVSLIIYLEHKEVTHFEGGSGGGNETKKVPFFRGFFGGYCVWIESC